MGRGHTDREWEGCGLTGSGLSTLVNPRLVLPDALTKGLVACDDGHDGDEGDDQ